LISLEFLGAWLFFLAATLDELGGLAFNTFAVEESDFWGVLAILAEARRG
jgi:hypothetical protein